jgi:hypothetical protein
MEKIETNVVKPDLSFFENETNNLILGAESETLLDSKIKSVEDFMSSNSGKGKSEEEKDALYSKAQELWYDFINSLKDARYEFFLNRKQFNFLSTLLLQKLEYDVNTVFFAIELRNMLADMSNIKYSSEDELNSVSVNATEITYTYHLIQKYKVKGLTNDAYRFSEILYRIGQISKIINYYESVSKNLSTEIQDWILTFEDNVNMESKVKEVEEEVK